MVFGVYRINAKNDQFGPTPVARWASYGKENPLRSSAPRINVPNKRKSSTQEERSLSFRLQQKRDWRHGGEFRDLILLACPLFKGVELRWMERSTSCVNVRVSDRLRLFCGHWLLLETYARDVPHTKEKSYFRYGENLLIVIVTFKLQAVGVCISMLDVPFLSTKIVATRLWKFANLIAQSRGKTMTFYGPP